MPDSIKMHLRNERIRNNLIFAVEDSDVTQFNRILQKKGASKQLHFWNNFLLRRAILRGSLPIVKRLLQFKGVQDDIDTLNNDVLITACGNGRYEILCELLKFDRVVKKASARNNIAFKIARNLNHTKIVNKLTELPIIRKAITLFLSTFNNVNNPIYQEHLNYIISGMEREERLKDIKRNFLLVKGVILNDFKTNFNNKTKTKNKNLTDKKLKSFSGIFIKLPEELRIVILNNLVRNTDNIQANNKIYGLSDRIYVNAYNSAVKEYNKYYSNKNSNIEDYQAISSRTRSKLIN
jgi:hypothetical protein